MRRELLLYFRDKVADNNIVGIMQIPTGLYFVYDKYIDVSKNTKQITIIFSNQQDNISHIANEVLIAANELAKDFIGYDTRLSAYLKYTGFKCGDKSSSVEFGTIPISFIQYEGLVSINFDIEIRHTERKIVLSKTYLSPIKCNGK